MIDGVDFIIDEFGNAVVEQNEFYDEDDNLIREWKDLEGNWHYDIIDAAADRGAEIYDEWMDMDHM